MMSENGDIAVEQAMADEEQTEFVGDVIVEEHLEGDEDEGEQQQQQQYEDPGTPLENEFQLEEEDKDSDDEDDFKIIIDDTKPNVAFRAPPGQRGIGTGKTTQKLDIDATANVNGTPIYDLDLASLEDKPWRKPGADITDYFNYGFTEDTWQIYCERQRKLRAEFGQLAMKQYFHQYTGNVNPVSAIIINERPIPKIGNIIPQASSAPSAITNLAAPTPAPTVQQQPPVHSQPQMIMRTVLTFPTTTHVTPLSSNVITPSVPAPTPQPVPTLTSSVPHPQPTQPVQPAVVQHIQTLQSSKMRSHSQSPPDSPGSTPPPGSGTSLQPPGETGPPGVTASSTAGAGPDNVGFPNMSIPPPRFPITSLPPPNFSSGPPNIPGIPGLPPTSRQIYVPPPLFGHPPPPGVPMRFPPPFGFPPPNRPRMPPIRHSFRAGFPGYDQIPRDERRSPASFSDKSSDEDDRERYERHRRPRGGGDHYRRSSRSRSPSSSSRQRGGRDYSGRERSTTHRSRHRSRSPVERSSYHANREERDYHDERKESRIDRDKRRKSEEDDSHKKMKKRKIKDEPLDDEEYDQQQTPQRGREKPSSKKTRDRSGEEKDRSSSGKKRKRSKERHDDDYHQEEDSNKA